MSGQLILDWPALALSLFDAFLLCWLGLTILLEANRRSMGVWLSADGLFLGAAFFIAHTAILRNGWQFDNPVLNFWWRAGWWPLVLSPFAWYCVILWYSSYWDDNSSQLHRRQAPWFGLTLVFTVGLLAWMTLADPLPDLGNRNGDLSGFSTLAILFPFYILLCILLALDAILRPGPSLHLQGVEARHRARPWLTASTLVLLLVCLLVAFALVWGIQTFSSNYESNLQSFADPALFTPLTGLDVIIELLITAAILFIGQAAMVYEVFSSTPLPRSGLKKRWLFAMWTGGIFAIFFSGVLIYFARPDLASLLFIPFLAGILTAQNRASALEQEAGFSRLRTLARPQWLYEQIFSQPSGMSDTIDIFPDFEMICTNVVQTRRALLLPVGEMTSFFPEKICFPNNTSQLEALPIPGDLSTQNRQARPLDPHQSGGYTWALPLISVRGLDGWFFIGERLDGSLYSMEEMEIARAAIERWMDNQAAAEITRRLLNLQQQKLAETRLLDQKARRILHDDVLPLLHTALLSQPQGEQADQISSAHRRISQLLRDAPPPPPIDIARNGLIASIRKIAEGEAALMKADLSFETQQEVEPFVAALSPEEAETIFYAVRECLRNIQKHAGMGGDHTSSIRIHFSCQGSLQISIENNGCVDEPGKDNRIPSTGQGLMLHNSLLAIYGGGIRMTALQNGNTRVTITLPVRSH
ncbi:MAG: hypothetical protein GYA15_01095 [Leptolinea sp.]|jgi:hypothetical protein|nr:hypothetical protein [Leptolinea sp.]